jgi:hypothetical protein
MVERPLRPSWLRVALLVLVGALLAVVVWWPMFKAYPHTPIEDGRYFFHQIEISKAAWHLYREVPLWNPFDCRGIPMWDHPENITASPIFWLTLPFSANVTIMAWNVVHVVVGFVGMWLLSRDDLRLSRAAAFVAAAGWAFGTVHAQYAGEHEAFVSFYDAPLLMFMWRRAETSWNWAVGTGLALAVLVYNGATYPLPLTIVFLGIESCTRLTSMTRAVRIAGAAGVVGLVGFTVAASRILPIADQFATHKRVMEDDFDSLTNLKTWSDMYLLRSPHWRMRMAGQQYVFGEYQAYIGFLGLGLVVLGVVTTAAETWWLLVVSLVLVGLMLGHFSPSAPWTVLHAHVPPFKSMRVPARFRLLLALPLSAYMGYAVDRVPLVIRRRLGKADLAKAARVALIAVGMFAVGDNAGLFTETLEYRFTDPPPRPMRAATRFAYGGADIDGDPVNQPRQNRAYTGCRAAWAYNADAAVWTGDVPQARADGASVKVEVANRTHNTFTVDVEASEGGGLVLLNTAYDKGWRTSVGDTQEKDHLLAVHVPVGRHRLHLRYWPKLLSIGIAISLASLLASLAFLFRGPLLARFRQVPASSSEPTASDDPTSS